MFEALLPLLWLFHSARPIVSSFFLSHKLGYVSPYICISDILFFERTLFLAKLRIKLPRTADPKSPFLLILTFFVHCTLFNTLNLSFLLIVLHPFCLPSGLFFALRFLFTLKTGPWLVAPREWSQKITTLKRATRVVALPAFRVWTAHFYEGIWMKRKKNCFDSMTGSLRTSQHCCFCPQGVEVIHRFTFAFTLSFFY